MLKVDRTTPAYRRVIEAGFEIDEPEDKIGSWLVTFKCVCGRVECFVVLSAELYSSFFKRFMSNDGMDVAAVIEWLGAVSIEHLRKDGYTEEQIKQIRKPYAVLDQAKDLIPTYSERQAIL